MRTIFTRINMLAFAAAALALPVFLQNTAAATSDTVVNFSIPVTTVIEDEPGSTHEVGSRNVPQKYEGMSCDVSASAVNQGSVHSGNDLIVASGTSSVVLADVEREPDVTTNASGTLELADSVSVSLQLGDDGKFSAGMSVELVCAEEEQQIEVCRDGTIITIPESERQESDTDTCPIEKITVCRDGKLIEINKTDRKNSDTDSCPAVKGELVCRDGKEILVTENDRRPTDTLGECPAPAPVPTPAPQGKGATTDLPNTGAGSLVAVLGTIFATGGVAQVIVSKRFH